MTIAIYARKSRFTDSGESIDNQIAMCKEYSLLHFGNENIFEVYNDEGFSGGNTNRPDLKKLFLNLNRIDILICYRLDRISRNVSDFTDILKLLDKANTSFVSVRENFDTSTPMGRAMIHIASVFAQLERETIAERIRDNKYRLARLGTWQGGVVPLGYKTKRIEHLENGKKKAYFSLEADIEKTCIVKNIFSLYLRYKNFAEVSRQLESQNIAAPNGGTFSRSTLKKIIKNPVYTYNSIKIYDYFYNIGSDIASPKNDFDGKHSIIGYLKTSSGKGRNPESKWIIACSEHTAIISSENWIEANKIIKNLSCSSKSNVAVFSGYLICKNCGNKLLVKGNRKDKHSLPVFYYRCACTKISFNGVLFDKSISEYLSKTSLLENITTSKYCISSDFSKFSANGKLELQKKINTSFSNILSCKKEEQRKRVSLFLENIVCSEGKVTICFKDKLF